MNDTNPGNCMEFLNVHNLYNYNQYVQKTEEIISGFSGEKLIYLHQMLKKKEEKLETRDLLLINTW